MEVSREILETTGSRAITKSENVQELWSGYGMINRYFLAGGKYLSIIVKHIQWPKESNHPRGWNTAISHQRKLKSYQVERNWYEQYAQLTSEHCRVPQCIKSIKDQSEILLIMEDLNATGFEIRHNPQTIKIDHAKSCLSWLANFHARFMKTSPAGLWETGTYWHLDTRPDEFERMQNADLKHVARAIDTKLKHAKYQTIVHGDAKLANFCFSKSAEVAAVDFQYVGKGCGMKDVAYFLSSCFDEESCEKLEIELLNFYFKELELVIDKSIDFQQLKLEWLQLYKYAWADFYRFLDGWNPGHWKMHGYSEKLTKQVVRELMG